jgi:hypothetical protein
MSSFPARRLGVLTVALLTAGLLAPTAVSAAPTGSAATFGERGSAFSDEGSMSAFATSPIEVRDLSYSCPSGRVPSGGFTDVQGSPFAPAIDCLVWYDITLGKTPTSYAPGGSVTRQQMAVFLHRTLEYVGIADLVDPPAKSQFRDVSATGEAGEAINVLASDELADLLGVSIVAGKTATTFDPGGRVSRAQMGSFIARTLEGVARFNGSTIHRGNCDNVFRDEASIPSTHRGNVKLLCAFGIVAGRSDGSYGPGLDVTRGQMAAFLMRLMDVFVEAKVTIAPDAYAEVYVDRGSNATACSNTGRDGSPSKPFCTIQAGINAAKAKGGYWVDIFVQPRPAPYAEAVVLASGQAFQIDVGSATEGLVVLEGSIRVDGADASDANVVYGFDIVGATTGVDVRSPGAVVLVANAIQAPTAVSVNQTGVTWVDGSYLDGSTVGVDLINTTLRDDLFGTFVAGNFFEQASQAYVRVPSTTNATVANANLSAWLSDFGNEFAVGADLGTSGGRGAIVPTTP